MSFTSGGRVGSYRKLGSVTVTVNGYYGTNQIPPVTCSVCPKLFGNELLHMSTIISMERFNSKTLLHARKRSGCWCTRAAALPPPRRRLIHGIISKDWLAMTS